MMSSSTGRAESRAIADVIQTYFDSYGRGNRLGVTNISLVT
jgi:hypothetical protein